MLGNELADEIIFVKEIMSSLSHCVRFEQAVAIPNLRGVNDEGKKPAKSVRLSKFTFQVRVALVADEGLSEVDVHEAAQKSGVASIAQFGTVVARQDR